LRIDTGENWLLTLVRGRINFGSHASVLHNAQYRLFVIICPPLKLSSEKKKKNIVRKKNVEKFFPLEPPTKTLPPFKMAANKDTDEDIQHLSVAQQCKCENRCIDYLELQSELNEVRLESKSVK